MNDTPITILWSALAPLLPIAVFLGVSVLILALFRRFWSGRRTVTASPYRRQPALLSAAEQRFFTALGEALGAR